MLLLAQLFCEISKDDVFIAYSWDIPILGNRELASLEINQNSSLGSQTKTPGHPPQDWL